MKCTEDIFDSFSSGLCHTEAGSFLVTETDGLITGVLYISDVNACIPCQTSNTAIVQCCHEITEFLSGCRKEFEVPFRIHGTAFQREVWEAVQNVPYGSVISYGELATQIGRKGAGRAVGNALRANSLLFLVPCHRIVLSSGSPGNYSAGSALKKYLLELESSRPG